MHEPHTGQQASAPTARAAAFARLAACLLITACGAVWIGHHALAQAIDLPTAHLDGAFQTASGLYRLKEGQWPGRDFFPYLGIGPLLVLLPLFLAAGADLAASVVAAQAVTQLAGVFAVALLWHLVFAPRRVLVSVAAGVVLFLGPQAWAAMGTAPGRWPAWFDFALWPGNSLRPLRAALPYLVAGGFWAVHVLCGARRARLRSAGWGVLAGACVLWSNDYAYTTGALVCAMAAGAAWRGDGPRWARAWPFAVAALLTAALVLAAATRGHVADLLRYNFADVAGDQWWMFMPYAPEARVFGWADAGRLLNADTRAPLLVLAAIGVWAAVRRSARAGLLPFIGLGLFAGGAAACIGGHVGSYFGAFRFWAAMLVLIAGLRALAWIAMRWLARAQPRTAGAMTAALAIGLGVAGVPLAQGALQRQQAAAALAARDPARFFVPELGGHLAVEWRDAVEHARARPGEVLVEEYWGLWSALRRGRSGWPVDAVIHALGSTRARAAAALARADVVTSTRRAVSPEWQPWSLSQNHWFHRELLDHWTPERQTPTTIVWRRRTDGPAAAPAVSCTVPAGGTPAVTLEDTRAGLHELTLRYRLTGSGRALLLVNNQLSPVTQGWASVDPRAGQAQLPVEVLEEGDWQVPLHVLGRPADALELHGCSARRLASPPADVWVPPNDGDDAFYLTDVNWDRGIARGWAGFFVPNTARQAARFEPGRIVRLANGEQRRILRTEPHGGYLHVHVDGAPWPSAVSGLPRSFSVADGRAMAALR